MLANFFSKLFDTSDYPARWRCGNWSTGEGWLHILSDLGVWSAYLAIPLVLVFFLRQRQDLPFRKIFLLFGAFILLCGTTHLMDAAVFWWPAYRLAGLIKLITAIVSWATVISLFSVLPEALKMRSPEELEREVAARRLAEEELMQANSALEQRVERRTAELTKAGIDSNRLAAIITSSADAIISKDLNGVITSWNAGAQQIFGYTAEEMIGASVTALIPADRLKEEEGILAKIRGGETAQHTETVRKTKDGRLIYVSVTASPIKDATGRVIGASKVARDITDRKRAEEALRESNQRFRGTFENAAVGIAHVDPGGAWLRVNERICQIIGYEREELLAKTWQDITHADDLDADLSQLKGLLAGETHSYTMEKRYLRKDGSIIWGKLTVSCSRNATGEVEYLITVVDDISQRKQGEAKLRESDERYRVLFDSAPIAVFSCDENAVIQHYNRHAVKLWGREPTVGVDRHCGSLMLRTMDGKEVPMSQSPINEVLRTGIPAFNVEVYIQRPDDSLLPVVVNFAPLKDVHGAITGAITTFFDSVEVKRVEEQLREAKDAAEAANRSKDRFLAVLSHELRTPLTPVLMTVAALERDPALSPELREDMAMIRRNIETETKLIDDLLDVSRIASGKLELHIEPLDLNGAVLQVCSTCRPQLSSQAIQLTLDLADDAGFIYADPARFQQVIWNVLKNAVKFTPRNGSIHVSSTRLSPSRIELRITDDGAGIPPEVLPRIFDAFEQGNASITRQFGGLGLGLAISKAIIELHGGTIRAESLGTGKGGSFIIQVPGTRPQDPAPSLPAAPEQAKPTSHRLLIVEDHADTRRALKTLLTLEGFTVTTATDVASALKLAQSEPFDILISDLGLPDASGYDLIAQIQDIQPLRGIAMSGYGMAEDIRQSLAAGFSEHLVKPIKIPQLLAAIQRLSAAGGEMHAS